MSQINVMQLKSKLKRIATELSATPQSINTLYAIEIFLRRLEMSAYRENFILKGGLLVTAKLGFKNRTTKDIDATLCYKKLDNDSIKKIIQEIAQIDLDDGFRFEINDIEVIREKNQYSGTRIHLEAHCQTLIIPFAMDITFGEKITPHEIEMSFPSLFGNTTTLLKSYNLETLLAEKLNAILVLGVANTRMKDFFDIHSIWHKFAKEIDNKILNRAITETANFRGNLTVLKDAPEILQSIKNSEVLADYWHRYQKTLPEASRYSFAEVCETVDIIIRKISLDT